MAKTLSVGITENTNINYVFFRFNNQVEMETFCSDLAAYIINKYTNDFFKVFINKNYGYMSHRDKNKIYDDVIISFSKISSKIQDEYKLSIEFEIYRYLLEDNTDYIDLDGFVRFRLKDFIQELEWMVDNVVDDFFANQQYEQFVELIQKILSTQKPVIRAINILPDIKKQYFICDENFEELTMSRIVNITNDLDLMDEYYFIRELSEDEFLLSLLIDLAPTKLIIHEYDKFKNKRLFETISRIFKHRMIKCDGCKHCNK